MARLAHGSSSSFLFSTLPLVLLLFLSRLPTSHSAKKQAASARREDIPYIKCQVCEKLARQLHDQVKAKEAEVAPRKVTEYEIIEIAENVCNLKKNEADWILQIDIVEEGDTLELVEQGAEGQCNSECKTIEQACQQVMGYSDTDVAEYMYSKRPSINSLVNYLCHDLSKACITKPPPVPKGRTPGEPFIPKSSKEAEMERIMKSMQDMPGAPSMKMYSKEDMLNMNNLGDEDDDDEDDEEDKFPSQLGKVLREKGSSKKDLIERILHGAKEAGAAVKRHVSMISGRVQKWWRGTKKSSKRAKGGKAEL